MFKASRFGYNSRPEQRSFYKSRPTLFMNKFRAFRIHQVDNKIVSRFDSISIDDLTAGEVVVKVAYSDINFKDALAATGTGKILRKYPLVGGIDLAGEVVSSSDPQFKTGQAVLVTGGLLSEIYDGGYAEYARVKSDLVVPIPQGLDARTAMLIGTAGFTAALAIHRMEQNGLTPSQGEVLVNGATGGVGSIAIDMLSGRGYDVVALTGKSGSENYLQQLGAKRILLRSEFQMGTKPMETQLWAGAIDNLGGDVLSWLIRTTKDWGTVASVGMAQSGELKGTVFPFILRGVNLVGANSVTIPRGPRLAVWQRIATDLKPKHLDVIGTKTVTLDELPGAFDAYIKGAVTGRTLVKIA
jgi:acrylyl-CoA reductase (NADPH)